MRIPHFSISMGWLVLATGLMTVGVPAFAQEEISEADQAIRIQKIIELDTARLEELKSDLVRREAAFQEMIDYLASKDAELSQLQEKFAEAEASGDADAATRLNTEITAQKEVNELVRSQSEVDFNAEKTVRKQLRELEIKIAEDRAALEQLEGRVPASTAPPDAAPVQAPITESTPPAVPGVLLLPGMPAVAPSPAPSTPAAIVPATAKQIEARQAAEKSAAKVIEAEQAIENFLVRKAALQRQIKLEQDLLESADQTVINVTKAAETRTTELESEVAAGAGEARQRELRKTIARNEEMLEASKLDVEKRRKNIEDFNERLQVLEQEQLSVEHRAEERREVAQAALKRSVWLESPLHPANLSRWALDRGPRILVVIVATVVIVLVIRFFVGGVARVLVGVSRRKRQRNTNRADTLSLSFGSALTFIVVAVSILLVFEEAGVDIKTVLGGAAILGVAIAFGAQNLMRDYFNGFIILLEDQYELNDLVQINNHTGRVERVSLRTTVLRDLAGKLYFIPNGEIRSVINRSYEWTRAILNVRVGYDEDVDRIMSILDDVARSLYSDPEFKDKVIDEPEMLGVDEFAQFGIIIRLMVRTVPDDVFIVKREMLRRIKNKFDELGIRIPVPGGVIMQPEV
jgi:small-conductance mechanosensitive channel